MYNPPVQRISVQEAKTQKRLSKSLLSFLMLYQMIFGFKFGCPKLINLKFKMAAQWLSFAMGCIMISTLSLTFMVTQDEGHYWRHISFVQYIPAFFIFLYTKYTVCDFIADLAAPESNNIGLVVWSYTLVMFVLKIIGAMMYCALTTSVDRSKMLLQFSVHVPMLALDVIPVVNSVVFYHVYLRMRDLKNQLSRREITMELLENNYRTVADCFDKFRSGYDVMFIWGFLTDSPKLMLVLWNHLHSLKTFKSWLMNISTHVYAMHATLQICIPAVFAEMINAQTDNIIMILHERLLADKEEAASPLLRYLKARPLLRPAWRLMPLDLRLPTAMLSMCATYLIVIIQFTHLYD